MNVLVVGANGLIGSTMLRILAERTSWEVFGTVRALNAAAGLPRSIAPRLISGVVLDEPHTVTRVLDRLRPDVVVNCAGLTKHKPEAGDPAIAIPINAWMPHWLGGLCRLAGARLIHVSTDCVFLGSHGGYRESDPTDATDVYGRTKALGEVTGPHAVTLRTSTIGHELDSAYGLLDWFLAQEGSCRGFTRAIFSGLPTVEFARVVRDVVIPATELSGLYHVAAKPIDKHDLLSRVASAYGKQIELIPDDSVVIDRSLNADRFHTLTGYTAPGWDEMIARMLQDRDELSSALMPRGPEC
jgi:dTDP-4-dehydrorhamnose reductase